MTLQQLPLGFRLRDDATFASYLVAADNQQAMYAIMNLVRGIGDNFLFLYGAEGSGRSHLLQAICHAGPEFNQTVLYLPLDNTVHANELFAGLENVSLLCLDDIDQIAGIPAAEEQLFHLFNRVRANNHRLIITSAVPPTALNIKLPDLKSRLAWGTAYQLHTLNDEQKLAALQLRAQGRGLDLDPLVGKFLLRRCPRDMGQLFTTLELLDQASLTKQRRLTIPFVKEVLGV